MQNKYRNINMLTLNNNIKLFELSIENKNIAQYFYYKNV